ncbi:YpdA family putative bacillithiol disulfide reductase [Paludibaculum fermentans]|uniref:YpdA family putative bacillithiol disulfide reductase n=1 Tax=Paludibaculum fermentans TaxID=1473598 RepID=A0A7S7NTR9_PALFE|nr:YpdA family putative bacillithiol disulfide reductase [Paludibaculum fermentans]QOY89671.1 YpdA family putative bacillithiol disulfide reductase [Paludibaculum fermentans]
MLDTIVVGAGPTGLACGIELKRRGLSCVLFDKGCLTNSLYHYPTNMMFFTTPELLEIGNIPMTSVGEKPVRVEALKYYRRVADHYGIDIHQYERVIGFEGSDGDFSIHTEDRQGRKLSYRARKVILATGYYDRPNYLNVPGEDLPKVIHYYKEAHPYYAHDVLVVGGKNSAAIAALELFWTGARVTMVHRHPELHGNIKYWIKPNIENRIKAGEVKAYFDSSVASIEPDAVNLMTPEGPVRLKNDFVFAMTGYRPDTDFLARHGIRFDPESQRPNLNPETLESERAGVYLAGVLVAGMHTNEIFIENGRFHGKQIADDVALKLDRV